MPINNVEAHLIIWHVGVVKKWTTTQHDRRKNPSVACLLVSWWVETAQVLISFVSTRTHHLSFDGKVKYPVHTTSSEGDAKPRANSQ